jgi:hypothetical protein
MNVALTAPIDIDRIQQESDVRHEPPLIPPKLADFHNASTVVQVHTPPDPADLPTSPPTSTPLPEQHAIQQQQQQDVPMSEPTVPELPTFEPTPSEPTVEKVNGVIHHDADINMDAPSSAEQPSLPPVMNGNHSSPNGYSSQPEEEGPPTKRARKHSNADQASTHFATPPPASNFASPIPENAVPDSATTTSFGEAPPPTASTEGFPSSSPPPPTPALEQVTPTSSAMEIVPTLPLPAFSAPAQVAPNQTPPVASCPSNISPAQFRFMQSTIRNIKKMKDAIPFLLPVDPIKLQIPHYPSIVKTPMDLSTVELKLNSSNPTKPDPNPLNPRYLGVEAFIADVRLIFSNCQLFNGPEHVVAQMGKRVEESFMKSIKQMPPPVENKPPVAKKISPPPPPPPPLPVHAAPVVAPVKKEKVATRKASTSNLPAARRPENDLPAASARPKREIHPPPPKDLPYVEPPKKARKAKRAKDDGMADQFKYCSKILSDLFKKQHFTIASPFYEPVDWVRMELPDYPKVIKKPMDLTTMRRKLDNGEYATPMKFYEDFRLMIRNCFTYNPIGTIVNQAGIELQRVFDEKWRGLPPLRKPPSEDEEEEEEEDDEERQRTIAALETQMESMKNHLSALKGAKPVKEIKKKKEKREKPPVASTSKPVQPKVPKPVAKKKSKKAANIDDDALSFEQKKDLSDAIGKLEGPKLEKVIAIIHDSVPELKNSSEEIELEVDSLPPAVLTKLYNLVIRPLKAGPKRNRGKGTGTGTGGLKRKSMDEDVEAEKIRRLEERMALFEQGANASVAENGPSHGAESDSDSSSGSDSSGSDSE